MPGGFGGFHVALDDDGGAVVGGGDLELGEAGVLVEAGDGALDGAVGGEDLAGHAHGLALGQGEETLDRVGGGLLDDAKFFHFICFLR